jgi:DNA-binding response OmpR family regulator
MVRIEGRDPQRLTQLEFRLLYALMTHRGEVIPSELIVDRVWGYSESGSRELVRGLVSRLRAKIEPDRSTQRFVHTVPGVGYFFDHESAESPQD